MSRIRSLLRKLRAPTWQLVAALGVMVGGAWLIGMWMVGIVLMLAGGLWGADAVLRDTDVPGRRPLQLQLHEHEDVLEAYRRAK